MEDFSFHQIFWFHVNNGTPVRVLFYLTIFWILLAIAFKAFWHHYRNYRNYQTRQTRQSRRNAILLKFAIFSLMLSLFIASLVPAYLYSSVRHIKLLTARHIESHNLRAAISYLEQLKDNSYERAFYLLMKARCYYMMKQPEQAIEFIKRSLEYEPEDVNCEKKLILIQSHILLKNYPVAIDELHKWEKNDDGKWVVIPLLLYKTALLAKEVDEAQRALKTLLTYQDTGLFKKFVVSQQRKLNLLKRGEISTKQILIELERESMQLVMNSR